MRTLTITEINAVSGAGFFNQTIYGLSGVAIGRAAATILLANSNIQFLGMESTTWAPLAGGFLGGAIGRTLAKVEDYTSYINKQCEL